MNAILRLAVIYLTKNKTSAAFQTVATAWIVPKICHSQPPAIYSQHSRLHPNRFIFGGVIAESVNAVFCPIEYYQDRHFDPTKKMQLQKYEQKYLLDFYNEIANVDAVHVGDYTWCSVFTRVVSLLHLLEFY